MTLQVKDAAGLTQAMKTTVDGSSEHVNHTRVDVLPPLPTGSAVIGRVGMQVGGADVAAGNPVPVTVGLTDAQLRAAAVTVAGDVRPRMTSGGIINAMTAATGANWTAFASQACTSLTIMNATGVTLEIRRGGTGATIWIPNGVGLPFDGLTNCSQIEVRRQDLVSTPVVVQATWVA